MSKTGSDTQSKTVHVRLPRLLHRAVKMLAEEEGISMNQLVATAVAEKMSALKTVDYLKERAARGSREKYERALSKVPDVEPADYDKL